jgi:hypothetical protein
MFRQFLNRAYQNLIQGSRQPRSRRAPRTSRPAATRLVVDGLEDRTLLSTVALVSDGVSYAPSTSVANSVTLSHNSATHRYTFVDTAETISLVESFGNFISPSGNGTHTVSFGDGNIPGFSVSTGNQNFMVNIEGTVAYSQNFVHLGTGIDTVNISPAAHNLNNILGQVTI